MFLGVFKLIRVNNATLLANFTSYMMINEASEHTVTKKQKSFRGDK